MLPPIEDMHPKIRALLEHWRALRTPQGLPGRHHLDAAAIPGLLPYIWMLDVVRDPLRYRFRLVGEAQRAAGSPIRPGMWMHELHEGGRLPELIRASLELVVTKGEPDWYRGKPSMPHIEHIVGLERLSLPLASDGREVDVVLNATVFHWEPGFWEEPGRT